MDTLVTFISEKEFYKLPVYQFSSPTRPPVGFRWKWHYKNSFWIMGEVTKIESDEEEITTFYSYKFISPYIELPN